MVKIKFTNKRKSTFRSRMEFNLRTNAQSFYPFVSRNSEGRLDFSNLSNYIHFVERRLSVSIAEVERLEHQIERIHDSIDEATFPSDVEFDEEVDCVPVQPSTFTDWDNWDDDKPRESQSDKEPSAQAEPVVDSDAQKSQDEVPKENPADNDN